MQITTKIETITPERANQLLDTLSAKQRNRRKHHVHYLRNELESDYWKINGETIKIDENGKLIDGQHRLAAVIASGKPLTTIVVFGIDENAYDTIDTGVRRNSADVLMMNGEKNATLLAAAIGVSHSLENFGKGLMGRSRSPTLTEEYLDRNNGIRDSVALARDNYTGLIHASLVAAMHWVYVKRKAPRAIMDSFVIGLESGFNPIKQSNFHLYRERLVLNIGSDARLRRNFICAMGLIAINATLNKDRLKQIDFRKGDNFPPIVVPSGN